MGTKLTLILLLLLLAGCEMPVNSADSGEYLCPICSDNGVVMYSDGGAYRVRFVCTACDTKSGWFETVAEGMVIWKGTK